MDTVRTGLGLAQKLTLFDLIFSYEILSQV